MSIVAVVALPLGDVALSGAYTAMHCAPKQPSGVMRSAGGGDIGGFGFPTWKPLPGWRRKSVIVRLQIVLQNNTGSDSIDSTLAIRLALSTKILLR